MVIVALNFRAVELKNAKRQQIELVSYLKILSKIVKIVEAR